VGGQIHVRARGKPSTEVVTADGPSDHGRADAGTGLSKPGTGRPTCDAMQVGAHTVSKRSWARDHSSPAPNGISYFAAPPRQAL
jgi:hypothetical protein